jgi:hypothetical protein
MREFFKPREKVLDMIGKWYILNSALTHGTLFDN